MNQPGASRTIAIAPVRKSVRLNASAERAFDVFTSGFDRWWPRSHHIGQVPVKEFVLEPFTGGRWYERREDGSECQWGKVLGWEPPSRLVLAWQLNPKFAYDPELVTTVEVRFVAESADVTRVELEHRDLERVGDEAQPLRDKFDSPGGWGAIIESFAKQVSKEMDDAA
jgi:uncharacterized protein YndB with AHSA1/START domain